MRTDLVDAAVWEEVCRLLEHPERLEQEYRRRLLQEEQQPDALRDLETRMGRLRQGIARLIDSYAEGLIDKEEFEPRIARMRERLKQIEVQAQQIQDEVSLERELTLILGRLDAFASRVEQGLLEADWSTRREIIRALVKRVEIDQEQVRVVFRVNPPPPSTPQAPSAKDAQSLQHCRRRDQPTTGQYLPGPTRPIRRTGAHSSLYTRRKTSSKPCIQTARRPSGLQETNGTKEGVQRTAQAVTTTSLL